MIKHQSEPDAEKVPWWSLPLRIAILVIAIAVTVVFVTLTVVQLVTF